jgi:DNA-binding PadR family transcriptional regulator
MGLSHVQADVLEELLEARDAYEPGGVELGADYLATTTGHRQAAINAVLMRLTEAQWVTSRETDEPPIRRHVYKLTEQGATNASEAIRAARTKPNRRTRIATALRQLVIQPEQRS